MASIEELEKIAAEAIAMVFEEPWAASVPHRKEHDETGYNRFNLLDDLSEIAAHEAVYYVLKKIREDNGTD